MSTLVGSVVFGPQSNPLDRQRNTLSGVSINGNALAYACNCIGPQPGETKCPCMLRGESERGRQMIENGVTVNGKRYKLVEIAP